MISLSPDSWKVVVVDNEPHSVEIIKIVLARHGSTLWSAGDGVDGLAMIHQKQPDIVLLDIQMPRMSGWDVLRHLKEEKQPCVVIAMTAHALDGDHDRILGAGFDGYIPKPFSPLELVGLIQSVLQQRRIP